jgi:hypothetical protein
MQTRWLAEPRIKGLMGVKFIPVRSMSLLQVSQQCIRLRTDADASELQLELQLRMIHGAGAKQSCGVAEQRIKQVKLRHAWLFHRSCRAIFACLPGRRHRCQTDLVLSLQGEEGFPSPVSPM